jgi:hypothetical protein
MLSNLEMAAMAMIPENYIPLTEEFQPKSKSENIEHMMILKDLHEKLSKESKDIIDYLCSSPSTCYTKKGKIRKDKERRINTILKNKGVDIRKRKKIIKELNEFMESI